MAFNLADLFEAVAIAVPERTALTCDGRATSFAALDGRADALAATLHRRGVGPGDRVAVALADRPAFVEALLAAWKLRAVPFNVHRHYVLDELHHLLGDADPVLVLTEEDQVAILTEACDPPPGARGSPRRTVVVTIAAGSTDAADEWPDVARSRTGRSGDDRYLIYTGGTTGRPKGVEWRHEDLFFAALGGGNLAGEAITAPELLVEHLAPLPTGTFVASPLSHGTAQWAALASLLAGGTVHLPGAGHFDAAGVLDTVAATGAAHLVLVGDAFALPLAEALAAEPDRWELGALVVVASGGAPLSGRVAQRLLAHLPGAVVVDGYGATETGGQGRRVISPGVTGTGPARFVPAAGTAVLDDDLHVVAERSGQAGRLARRGHVPIGYRNDPDRTRRTFPVIDGERWALSGDLARAEADGTLTLLGRTERTINSGGEKIYPGEVEAAILAHPDVVDALVVPLPHLRFGEQVAAVVRLGPGAELSLEGLRRHCHATLARFKLPRRLLVVDELPHTPAGKPDHVRALALFDRS